MAISPLSNVSRAIKTQKTVGPSKTYALDFDFYLHEYTVGVSPTVREREFTEVVGTIDGVDALKQFIRKALCTARYRYIIYTSQYGCELESLIGQDVPSALLQSEIPRIIREALIYDDRVNSVDDFVITRAKDSLYVSFTVYTVYGAINEEVTV